jgi:mono/diheme cytochrome c family protein
LGDPLATGGRIFGEACANCHGTGASGLAAYSGSLGDFREILSGKVDRMPDFHGAFSDEEIAALYAYVRATAR